VSLRWKLAVALAVLSLSTLAACTVSAAGGIIGGAGALVFAVFVLMGTASQTGCEKSSKKSDESSHCLSVDRRVDDAAPVPSDAQNFPPCLKPDLTPCLKVAMPDAGVPDAHVGPCLELRPCLDVPPCLSPPRPDPETPMPVCLSVDPLDSHLMPLDGDRVPRDVERARSLDKLAETLPADVIARLRDE
jgi:hypothetical protein